MPSNNIDASVKLPSLMKLKKIKSRSSNNSPLKSKSLNSLSDMTESLQSLKNGKENLDNTNTSEYSTKQKLDANQLRERIAQVLQTFSVEIFAKNKCILFFLIDQCTIGYSRH
jgi:hypothetical protein